METLLNDPYLPHRWQIIDQIGLDKLLQESGAVEIDRQGSSVLWRVERLDRPPLVMLEEHWKEKNGGWRSNLTRVPDSFHSVLAAVAWSFGVDQDEGLLRA